MADPKKYDITVAANATYVADQSDPSRNQYVFAYKITVTNTGSVPAKLISRHWIITDSEHRVQEVKGLGVAPTRWSPRTAARSTRRYRRLPCPCRAFCIRACSHYGRKRERAAWGANQGASFAK